MSATPSSLLQPEPQPLWWTGLLSAAGHAALVLGALGVSWLAGLLTGPREPVLRETLEVSVVSLPKTNKRVPDKATRAAATQGEVKPAPKPPEPPPVKQSDLAVPEPTPKAGTDTDDRQRREAQRRALERQRLMEDLMAADGPVDRDATDPNSDSDVALNVHGRGGSKADPEYIAWVAKVQQLMMANFHPLSAITAQNPGLKTRVTIDVDPRSGRILSHAVSAPSGVPAYDAAATRAVDAVGTIPLPPAAWLPLLADGLAIDFIPPR